MKGNQSTGKRILIPYVEGEESNALSSLNLIRDLCVLIPNWFSKDHKLVIKFPLIMILV